MTAAKEFAKLKAISIRPQAEEERWLRAASDATQFLIQNTAASDVLLYASMPSSLIHGVFTPASQITPPDIDDLLRAYVDPDDSWVIQRSWGGGEGHRVYLEPPMDSPGCKSLVGSEKIIYRRSFEGMPDFKVPTELSQKLIHSLGLHLLEERQAYCRLNDEGDLEDVITIFEEDPNEFHESCRAIFIRSHDLAQYLALSETVLFRKFDFTRAKRGGGFSGWHHRSQRTRRAPDMSYNYGFGDCASYANGYQIGRTTLTVEQIVEEWKASEDKSNKQYETFKIQDFKNRRLVECSASPDSLGNYFTESDKPFTTSPAFFKPEVLHKYKADPEKYTVEHRSITCRNSWYLKTYDINDDGQVHTYIGYLGDLPYSEQQYWKLYNEWPRGPISARAYQTDFEGNFSTEPDPLVELEYAIEKVEEAKASWWTAREGGAKPKVLYPATASAKEWADEILALDQLVVEGFYPKGLRSLAAKVGITLDRQWGSLRIVEECLALSLGAGEAKEVVSPLRELHYLRSKVKGHATAERKTLESNAKRDHGSLRAHFTALAQRSADAFERIAAVLRAVG